MAATKNERKVRLFCFLPYGHCSKYATMIEGLNNQYARALLLGDNPEETIVACEQRHKAISEKAKYICHRGLAKDIQRVCGSPPTKRSFRALTRTGLSILTETTAINTDDDEGGIRKEDNSKPKGSHLRSEASRAAEIRELLDAYAGAKNENETFDETLLEAVIDDMATPLTYAIDIASNTKINLDKYSQNQRYNIWRLSHVNAMFFVNGHLTYLDRRHYDTGFAIDNITDSDSYEAYIRKYGHTMASLTYHALTGWYSKNPEYYRITQRYPADDDAYSDWLSTPAFYAARELPDDDDPTQIGKTDKPQHKQKADATHIGLAAGKHVNYVCYHTKPNSFTWNPKKEYQTKERLTNAVSAMKKQNPQVPYSDKVDFALMFCPTYHQFLAMFDTTKRKHVTGKKRPHVTDDPYTSTHIIPVNDAGTFLLWCLLEYSPSRTEARIHAGLVNSDDDFEYSTSQYYPLKYQGKRVFSGYTMDIGKIQHALEDHLDGHDFYICCFAEQAPWYQKLFPGKTIL